VFRIPIPKKNQSSFIGIDTVPLGINDPPLYISILIKNERRIKNENNKFL